MILVQQWGPGSAWVRSDHVSALRVLPDHVAAIYVEDDASDLRVGHQKQPCLGHLISHPHTPDGKRISGRLIHGLSGCRLHTVIGLGPDHPG